MTVNKSYGLIIAVSFHVGWLAVTAFWVVGMHVLSQPLAMASTDTGLHYFHRFSDFR